MDYSILAQNVVQDADGILFDVHSLYAHFLRLVDLRGRRGRRPLLKMENSWAKSEECLTRR